MATMGLLCVVSMAVRMYFSDVLQCKVEGQRYYQTHGAGRGREGAVTEEMSSVSYFFRGDRSTSLVENKRSIGDAERKSQEHV